MDSLMPSEPDWRVAVWSTTTSEIPAAFPGELSHPSGSLVTVVTMTRDQKGNLLSFSAPSAAALALNIARRAANDAMQIRPTLLYTTGPSPWGNANSIRDENIGLLFDYLEQSMIAVTFSFQALEAYSNFIIARGVTTTHAWLGNKNSTDRLTAIGLERRLSTEEKLGVLLPDLPNVTTPKKKAIWNNFHSLKQKRDASTHIKSTDQNSRVTEPSDLDRITLFYDFLRSDVSEWPKSAVMLINYFARRDIVWPWLAHELEYYGIVNDVES
jgi:hypothetical protein